MPGVPPPPGLDEPHRGHRKIGSMTAQLPEKVSDIFNPADWRVVEGFEDFTDITYHRQVERDENGEIVRDLPTVRIAFDRPEVRNAFRPHTVDELYRALDHARMTSNVGTVLLTGNGPSPKDGGWAFCSGGDQRIRGRDGYHYASGETAESIDPARAGRLHILEVQRLIRTMPKVEEYGKFKQTDATVGSFDAGYGSALLARQVGQKFAREIFFLAKEYNAQRMYEMGAVNDVVPHAELENKGLEYAAHIARQSPQAIRMLKYAFNLPDDGMLGQQVFAGEATRMAYMTDEAVEGRDAFLQKRDPDWSNYPYYF